MSPSPSSASKMPPIQGSDPAASPSTSAPTPEAPITISQYLIAIATILSSFLLFFLYGFLFWNSSLLNRLLIIAFSDLSYRCGLWERDRLDAVQLVCRKIGHWVQSLRSGAKAKTKATVKSIAERNAEEKEMLKKRVSELEARTWASIQQREKDNVDDATVWKRAMLSEQEAALGKIMALERQIAAMAQVSELQACMEQATMAHVRSVDRLIESIDRLEEVARENDRELELRWQVEELQAEVEELRAAYDEVEEETSEDEFEGWDSSDSSLCYTEETEDEF